MPRRVVPVAAIAAAIAAIASRWTVAAPPPGPAAAKLPVAAGYGNDRDVPLAPVEAEALDAALARLSRAERPRVSGALVVAARDLARLAADGVPDALARRPVRAALARGYAFDPGPTALLVQAPPESAAATLASAISAHAATHVGIGAAERDGIVSLVLLASERKARLSAFPREVAPGTRAVLSGALAGGLARPRVFVALPSGAVREASSTGTRGFSALIEFPAPGRYSVEVLAEGDSGPEVAALLTVVAGGAPIEAPAPPRAPLTDPPDDAAAESAVVAALNATRSRHGLAPLASAPDLAAIARRHSGAMAAAGRVAHVLPGSGDLGDRLRRGRVPYRRAYENVARAASALAAHEAAEESPAHLGNVLRPDALRVGVGIAHARLASGDATVYLTEVFIEPPDDGSSSRLTPEGRVREALWAERARLRLPPLTSDASLDAAAREAAASMRARDATDAPELGTHALALGRELAAVDVFVASSPAEATRSANLKDRRFRRVGVGVASGDSRRFGAGRIWVAVVYTD